MPELGYGSPRKLNIGLLPHSIPSDQVFPQLALLHHVFESLLADGQLPPNSQLNTIHAVETMPRPLVYGPPIGQILPFSLISWIISLHSAPKAGVLLPISLTHSQLTQPQQVLEAWLHLLSFK